MGRGNMNDSRYNNTSLLPTAENKKVFIHSDEKNKKVFLSDGEGKRPDVLREMRERVIAEWLGVPSETGRKNKKG